MTTRASPSALVFAASSSSFVFVFVVFFVGDHRLGRQFRQRIDQLVHAQIMLGGNGDRPRQSPGPRLRPAASTRPSHLLAARITGLPDLRSASAMIWSPAVTPARASIRNSSASASAMAVRVCLVMRWATLPRGGFFKTGRIDQAQGKAFNTASTAWRSRVTPGVSCTMAAVRPASRLKRRDLPDIGASDDGEHAAA